MMKIAVYKAEIKQLCWQLRERFQSDCIILHGSVARGTHTLKSDVDIIVVGGNLADNFFTRLYELSELRDGKTPFEIVGYTLAEWEDMMPRFHLTTLEALQWGIPLYGEALFAQWHERFTYWKSLGLHRGKVSWFIPPQLEADVGELSADHFPRI
jgi:predicted nucleotidyltransferase